MACVALASLISTIQLEFLQPFPKVPLHHQPPIIQSFFDSISSLQAFLQKSSGGGAAIRDLEIQIRDFALKAEDDIEIQISNFVLAKGREDQEKASQQLHLALQEAAENASELLNISNNAAGDDDDNESQPPIHWRKHASESGNDKSNGSSLCSSKLVGSPCKNNRGKIISELLWGGTLTIISIVGMVGIGKTTLAKSVYGDPKVEKHFNVRGWITMPQKYNNNQLLRLLLLSLSPAPEKKFEKESFAPEEVQVQVRNHLLGKRYLIVLDNLQLDNWGDIRGCFPQDTNGSCILVTTTHFDRYVFCGLRIYIHNMTLLDPNESWDLFCSTFSLKGSMSKSPELEKIRSNIIEICDGLPLTIVEVAKRLSKCNDVLKKWEKIKKEIESLGILDHNALTFLFNKLSQILKVCFLYLGVFPKRKEIKVKNLIGLWIAEGYFEPLEFEKQESQGYAYLQQLIERSLVLICNHNSIGKIKTCRMHSAMHSFCVGEAQKEGIFCAVNTLQHSGLPLSDFANSSRWLSLCKHSFDYYVLFSSNNPRSLFFFDEDPKTFVPFKLLRVLAFVPSPFLQRVSMHLGDLIFLRYLFISQRFEGLGNILSKYLNLHTLIVYGDELHIGAPTIHLASKIWGLPLLTHLELGDMYTMDPPYAVKAKLQTLSCVSPTHCGMEVFPNLRKLKIFYKDDLEFNHTHGSSSNPIFLGNFGYLKQLQRLTISVSVSCAVLYTERFMCPLQLQKLSLSGMNLSKRDLTVIGMLPELKVLKLENAFLEGVCEVVEGGFRELRFLLVKDKNLQQLLVNKNSFKQLERLVLRCCYYLEEIPYDFVHILTLKSIELDRCSPTVVTSAKRVKRDRIKLIIHKTEDEPPTYPLSELTIALGDESQIGFGAPITEFPCRISEIPQLRHLELTDVYIADPPSMVEGKLKTLSLVVPFDCRKKVYFSFPNIKKLKLFYNGSSSNSIFLDKLWLFEQLESLTISLPVGCTATFIPDQFSRFPLGLMKLKLSGTNWWNLRGFGKVMGYSLEVLKLENVLLGGMWEVDSEEFPNLRKLKIFYKDDLEFNHTHGSSSNPIILGNFGYLKQLQRLTISVSVSCAVVYTERFMCPLQLQKLSLSGMNLSKRDLTVIGMLPELKVLKLENAFLEGVCKVVEGGFRELRFLLVKDKNLQQLLVNKNSFKQLERLVLRCCYYLEEIPYDFVHILTLKSIELDRCSPTVVTSAKRVKRDRIKLIIHKTEDEPPTYPLSELTIALGDESQIGFGAPTTEFPCRISELPQLRHLELTDVYIADPPSMVEGKLKTLSLVVPCHCCRKVYFSFPNIKKLKLFYNGSSSNSIFLDKLWLLEQLESLTISLPVGCTATFIPDQFSRFPLGLMKLKLSGTNWWNLRGFGKGMGYSLEVLKLENVLLGRMWEVGSEEFPNLRFLLLQDKKLKHLKVDEKDALPCLEHLVLRFCYGLKEVSFPWKKKLKSIELFWCNPSAIACAKQIFEKRLDRGDDRIELKIDGDIYDERPN